MSIIATPMGYVMEYIYNLLQNYGYSIIAFALLAKVLMLPLSIKQKKSMIVTQRINPKLQELQKKYANNQEKYSQEVQKLYDEYGASPMGGCGTMLLTFPIMIGLYGVIIQPLTYFMQLTGDQIAQIAELLNYQIGGNYHYQIELATLIYENFDKVAHVAGNLMQVNFSLGPISMAAKPTFSQVSVLWLLPIVSGATSYLMSWLQQKMNPMQQSNPQMQGSNKMMMLMMPLMSIWFGFMLPVGLTWYWICNNVLAAVQEVLMSIWTKKQLEKSQNK